MKYKVILNVFIANKLLKEGFVPIKFEMSRKVEGRVAFVFENTEEFQAELTKLATKN